MIYLDNAATTKMYDEVIDIEKDFEKNFFANPSALHSFGMDVENKVKEAREILRIGMNSMYHILQSGELRSIKIGRIYKIKKENVIEYIDRKSKERIKE